MGCDIHMYVEYREKGGNWQLHPKHTYDTTEKNYINQIGATNRSYDLFGILADVRGSGCIYHPRGFPKDMSPKLKAHTDKWLEHTPHWLTLPEFQKCLNKYDKQLKRELKQRYKEEVEELKQGVMTQEEFDERWKDDPNEKKKIKITNIFYDWERYPWDDYIHPGFFDIIPYLNKYEDELKAEYILLEQEPPKYEFRLVFYFDS